MDRRDEQRECYAGICPDRLIDLILAGQGPNEWFLEMLLDRLEPARTPEARP